MNCFQMIPAGTPVFSDSSGIPTPFTFAIAKQVSEGVQSCEDGQLVMLTGLEYKNLFSPQSLGIGPVEIGNVYAWGLASVLAMWAVGYVAGRMIGIIKKI